MNALLKKTAEKAVSLAFKTKAGLVKRSPEILVATGIVGVVAGTILACQATLKCEDILDEAEEEKNMIAEAAEKHSDEYSVEDQKKDTVIVYTKLALNFIKLYGPAAACYISGLGCILGGFGILKKRYGTLIAAYGALEEGYKAYRNRVKEVVGEEKEKEIAYGKKTKVTEILKDENGNDIKQQTETRVITGDPEMDARLASPYARLFDEMSREWKRDPQLNRYYLEMQEKYFTGLLKRHGHVFLNEVYDALDIPRTPTGAICGWIYKPDEKIDFGIHDVKCNSIRSFIEGHEASILLDFNCQGIIYNLI